MFGRTPVPRYNPFMKYPTIFDLFEEEFSKAGIPYVLVGGFAVNFHGLSRQTVDIDFMIASDHYQKALGIVMENTDYREFHRQELFARLKDAKGYGMDVDFLFVDSKTLSNILQEGKKVKIAGREMVVPSLRHLIALKLHSIKNNPEREGKDLFDIHQLIQLNKLDVTTSDFKKWCLTFGTELLYTKIKETAVRRK